MKIRVRRRRIAALVTTFAVASVALCVALVACSNNGEGERCQVENNNDDCQDGLICLSKSNVNQGYNNGDRCCPVDRSTATHPACTQLQNPIAGDSSPPPDTGPTPTNDSGNDTGTDATQDSGSDTGADLDAADADGG